MEIRSVTTGDQRPEIEAMGYFRKKPVVIEAEQFTVENWRHIEEWSGRKAHAIGNWKHKDDIVCMQVQTLEGVMHAEFGDWIIKGIKGEFYPCKPDIFEATYDPVDLPDR